MPEQAYTKDFIKQSIQGKLQRYYGKTLREATPYQTYYAVASTLRDQIMEQWVDSRERDNKDGGKRVYYLCIEFLLGRAMFNNALNLLSTE